MELAVGATRAVEKNLRGAVVVDVAQVRLPAVCLSTGRLRAFLALDLVARLSDRLKIRTVRRRVQPFGSFLAPRRSARETACDDVIRLLKSRSPPFLIPPMGDSPRAHGTEDGERLGGERGVERLWRDW